MLLLGNGTPQTRTGSRITQIWKTLLFIYMIFSDVFPLVIYLRNLTSSVKFNGWKNKQREFENSLEIN